MGLFDDSVAPVVSLISPADNSLNSTDPTPDFVFNVTDDLDSVLSCVLFIDGTAYGENGSVLYLSNG